MFGLSRHSRLRSARRITIFIIALAFVVTLAFKWAEVKYVSGQITIADINPNQSTLDPSDPDGASGGRVNGLAAVAGNNQRFYAATEWGGLYRSNDGGLTWDRLNNHRPTVTWDVEVSPTNQNLVIATSFYDGRVNSISGINVSNDGGNTWTHPATSVPPVGFCSGETRREELTAFGISFDPANAQNVYVGTNCGLAISNNAGTTWTFVDPTPGDLADDVWDVVAHHGGVIDTFGDDGHQRSTDGGANWTTAAVPLPSGQGSIAASPDEANVIFVSTGQNVFESDNGGATWTNLGTPDSRRQGRIDFVATNDRAGNAFDLWFGDVSLFRAGCTSNPAGGGLRCPVARTGAPTSPPPAGWAGPFTRNGAALPPPATQRAHDDAGDIVFDSQAANDACPRIFSSDGGVYFNTLAVGPGCQNPVWEQPNVTPHALWLFALDGADQAGANAEDLYFGLQDNGTYASTNAGVLSPTWNNIDCCDGHDVTADPNRVVYDVCCGLTFFARNPGMTGGGAVNNLPAGRVPIFRFSDAIDRFDNNSYVIVTNTSSSTLTNGRVFITTNITASPVTWTQIGAATSPVGACGVQASGPAANPTFFVHAGRCNGDGEGTLWRYTGTAPGGAWQQINPPGNVGGFGIIAADPNNPNRIFASHLNGTNVNMVLSTNGGMNWTVLTQLDNLMTGDGEYKYINSRAGTGFVTLASPPGWSCVSPGAGAAGPITCKKSSVAVGELATFTVIATVNCNLTDGAIINNTASASAATPPDNNPANNTAMATITASNPAPVITCPKDLIAVAPKPGDTSAIVTYPEPMVIDNCPGSTVVCSMPSGSVFPLGTTTVNCTATDTGGRTASCSFKVTVFDVCLQDNASGDFLVFNSFTGEYLFTRCATGFTLAGIGKITKTGCLTKLTEAKIEATLDRCIIAPLNRGSATIKPNPIGGWFYINDTNTANNTCMCP